MGKPVILDQTLLPRFSQQVLHWMKTCYDATFIATLFVRKYLRPHVGVPCDLGSATINCFLFHMDFIFKKVGMRRLHTILDIFSFFNGMEFDLFWMRSFSFWSCNISLGVARPLAWKQSLLSFYKFCQKHCFLSI